MSTVQIPRQIQGPADTAHQVRSVNLQVSQHPDGGFLVSSSQAPGWSVLVRTQIDLVKAVQQAFTESQCAAYAAWRGQTYDLDDTGVTRPRPRRKSTGRQDVHSVEEWMKMEDGRWRSPGGRAYRADSEMALRVAAKRKSIGLPT